LLTLLLGGSAALSVGSLAGWTIGGETVFAALIGLIK